MVDNCFLTNIGSHPVGFNWRINCSVADRVCACACVCLYVPWMCFDF